MELSATEKPQRWQ